MPEIGNDVSLAPHFARFLSRICRTRDPELTQLFAGLCQAAARQHSCITLDPDHPVIAKLEAIEGVTRVIGNDRAAVTTPLVLWEIEQQHYFYLQRYFEYERDIAEQLIARNVAVTTGPANAAALDTLFLDNPALNLKTIDPKTIDQKTIDQKTIDQKTRDLQTVDWQKVAAFQCLKQQLVIISGGPGTGKTTTIVKIIAALRQQSPALKIGAAAPTGKAAMRLRDSMRVAVDTLPRGLELAEPVEVNTLHRLLGMRSDGRSFRYNQQHRLNLDLLIVDEVSMIDIDMFSRLLAALKDDCRLILLGDPDQLPSVEAGRLMADLCRGEPGFSTTFRSAIAAELKLTLPGEPARESLLADARCHLRHSYRFSERSGIGRLAGAVRDAAPVDSDANPDARIIDNYTPDSVLEAMHRLYADYLAAVRRPEVTAETLLDLFDRCRLLAPTRESAFGVQGLNERFEADLLHETADFYHGKPVMISRNNYHLGLFNGDIGICVTDENAELKVAFRQEDGLAYFPPGRLPAHESCFAMTVHKAQGSEFDQVLLVLPVDESRFHDLVSRELLYTGITRARQSILLFCRPTLLEAVRPAQRGSGLAHRFTLPAESPPAVQQGQLELF